MKWSDPKLRKLDIDQGSGICDDGSSPNLFLICEDGSSADLCGEGNGASGTECTQGPTNK